MKSDILVIGGGASGLMAALQAARSLSAEGRCATVTVLEKMPRPARKLMITGKGRCNFTNLKEWNDFSAHVRAGSRFVKSAWYGFSSADACSFFEREGVSVVVERGDRAFPASHRASDIVDALVRACRGAGVRIETDAEVSSVEALPDGGGFRLCAADGRSWSCLRLILATGGLSYPSSGSSGDGFRWAQELGHSLEPAFPSLTALVPRGYKQEAAEDVALRHHIDRETPLAPLGERLCGVSLKNVSVRLLVEGTVAGTEFGDIDFTDGGIEGPVGFQLSRKAVKSMLGGSRVALVLDLKPGVPLAELSARVQALMQEVALDRRSARLGDKEKGRILLGKLMPWALIPGFVAMHGRLSDPALIAAALKEWRFDLAGFVGYERAVVTAGGVCTQEVIAKTMASRLVPGLYFCGEILDIDSDTGGYNLQTAFSTGALAGRSAAASLSDSL